MVSDPRLLPVELFKRSVLKQRKYRELTTRLGPTDGLACLDIGSDNGVISYLLRQGGGTWKSADLDANSVQAIRELVETEVYQIGDGRTPFADGEFDRVVIVDFLEHIHGDRAFMYEMARVLKPSGVLIINVPRANDGLLRRLRYAVGQTDENHGHVRPGYTIAGLRDLVGGAFAIESYSTYSGFFSELIDTLIVAAVSLLKRRKGAHSAKGLVVTGQDLRQHSGLYRMYSVIYPVVWLFSQLDRLLFFQDGYMLIASARANAVGHVRSAPAENHDIDQLTVLG